MKTIEVGQIVKANLNGSFVDVQIIEVYSEKIFKAKYQGKDYYLTDKAIKN